MNEANLTEADRVFVEQVRRRAFVAQALAVSRLVDDAATPWTASSRVRFGPAAPAPGLASA